MKYVLFLTGSLFIIVTSCAGFGSRKSLEHEREQSQIEQEQKRTDKIYEGSAFGYRGPIRVQVRLSGGSISEITVVDSIEDRFVGGSAIEELIETVTELNSADVDAISGATITSKGFLEAVRNAIMSYD